MENKATAAAVILRSATTAREATPAPTALAASRVWRGHVEEVEAPNAPVAEEAPNVPVAKEEAHVAVEDAPAVAVAAVADAGS